MAELSELITIARFRDLPEAELARGKLESEGIPAVLADQYLVGVNWSYSFAVGGVKVQVPIQFAEEARAILDVDDSAALSNDQPSIANDSRPEICPSCGSEKVRYRQLSRKVGAISLMLGFPIPVWGRRLDCQDCGHTLIPERIDEPYPDVPAAMDPRDPSSSSEEENQTWIHEYSWEIMFLMFLICLAILIQYAS